MLNCICRCHLSEPPSVHDNQNDFLISHDVIALFTDIKDLKGRGNGRLLVIFRVKSTLAYF